MRRMPKARFGTFAELLHLANEPLRPLLVRLREILLEIHPEACEVTRLGDRATVFGVGPRKMIDGYAYILPYQAWVNLGFFRGAALEDPDGLLEGTGAKMRHVKIRSLAEADRPALRSLIKAAITERVQALLPRPPVA